MFSTKKEILLSITDVMLPQNTKRPVLSYIFKNKFALLAISRNFLPEFSELTTL